MCEYVTGECLSIGSLIFDVDGFDRIGGGRNYFESDGNFDRVGYIVEGYRVTVGIDEIDFADE